MENFKVGELVYAGDWCYGRIVEIEENLAYIQFETDRGGGCVPFELSELKHEKWCITTDGIWDKETVYLAWQNPAWDEDGYFWTSRDNMDNIISNSTSEHPFIFNNRKAAIKHLKSINIPQKCRIVRWL